MAKRDPLKLTNSKKVNQREAKQARKEFSLEDDLQPSLRFVDEEQGEVALFFNGAYGLCSKTVREDGSEEIKVVSKTTSTMFYDFGDPAKCLMTSIAAALELLAASAGQTLTLHMLKAHIDQLAETSPLKDAVARKTLRKYKMRITKGSQ
jgi:hypothetical protein